jgi:hypothetical protein
MSKKFTIVMKKKTACYKKLRKLEAYRGLIRSQKIYSFTEKENWL